jgi:hypothetical protein
MSRSRNDDDDDPQNREFDTFIDYEAIQASARIGEDDDPNNREFDTFIDFEAIEAEAAEARRLVHQLGQPQHSPEAESLLPKIPRRVTDKEFELYLHQKLEKNEAAKTRIYPYLIIMICLVFSAILYFEFKYVYREVEREFDTLITGKYIARWDSYDRVKGDATVKLAKTDDGYKVEISIHKANRCPR